MVIFRPAAFIAVNWGTVMARCSEFMLKYPVSNQNPSAEGKPAVPRCKSIPRPPFLALL